MSLSGYFRTSRPCSRDVRSSPNSGPRVNRRQKLSLRAGARLKFRPHAIFGVPISSSRLAILKDKAQPTNTCGAKTRAGTPCQSPAMRNGRCRMHGGKSTGPRTEEGKRRQRLAVAKHGMYAGPGHPMFDGEAPGFHGPRWVNRSLDARRVRDAVKMLGWTTPNPDWERPRDSKGRWRKPVMQSDLVMYQRG